MMRSWRGGGALSKWQKMGAEVYCVAFSSCQDSIPDGWPRDVLEDEMREATKALGIPPANIEILGFKVREMAKYRQEILDEMIRLRGEIKPDLVLIPDANDLHQDHQVVSNEGLRAFKNSSLLYYEVPWNNIQFKNEAFVSLDEDDVKRKLQALSCYKSQQKRHYMNPEFTLSQLRFHGGQIGVPYAESFSVVRWMM